MRFWRFKLGFVTGYAVATIRHSKDADPLIERLKRFEAAGVERIMLQDFIARDLEMIDLAGEVLIG